MPLYASPEQLMRERSELARKGIARGRSFVVMGGQTDTISTALKDTYTEDLDLPQALGVAVRALSTSGNAPSGSAGVTGGSSGGGSANGAEPTLLDVDRLEVAVLERSRPRRAFRRISGAALAALLPGAGDGAKTEESTPPAGED